MIKEIQTEEIEIEMATEIDGKENNTHLRHFLTAIMKITGVIIILIAMKVTEEKNQEIVHNMQRGR